MRNSLGLLLLLAAAPLAAAPASPRDSLVVSTAWLSQHLKDTDLVLLHVGDKDEYAASHIPGARFVNFSEDLAQSEHTAEGLMLEMLPAETLRQRLEALGISDASRIVVYFGKDWVSPATRVLFTLDYAGLGARSSILDGGMPAWTKEGHDVTSVAPEARAGKLSPLHIRPLVVDGAWVLAHLQAPDYAVVDGRAKVFYDGTETGHSHAGPEPAGHIRGAHSVPFTETTDDDLRLRPAAELEALFTGAGVKPGQTVVGYCHIGQQATAMLFAARTLGHPVLLYDGSFEDWTRHSTYPIDGPAPAAKP